jgi:hypothetical protein
MASNLERSAPVRHTTRHRAVMLAGNIALTLALATASAYAGDARADELSELRDRMAAQEQKILVLERKLELNDEATQAAASSPPHRARLSGARLPNSIGRRSEGEDESFRGFTPQTLFARARALGALSNWSRVITSWTSMTMRSSAATTPSPTRRPAPGAWA